MAEGTVDRIEKSVITGWSRQLDESLTWVRTNDRYSPGHLLWWPGLDQKLTDFHALYERACLED